MQFSPNCPQNESPSSHECLKNIGKEMRITTRATKISFQEESPYIYFSPLSVIVTLKALHLYVKIVSLIRTLIGHFCRLDGLNVSFFIL